MRPFHSGRTGIMKREFSGNRQSSCYFLHGTYFSVMRIEIQQDLELKDNLSFSSNFVVDLVVNTNTIREAFSVQTGEKTENLTV